MTTETNGNGFMSRYGAIIQTVMVVGLLVGGGWAVVGGPLLESVKTLQRDMNADHAWTQKQDVQIKHLEEAVVRIDDRYDKHVVPRSENEIKSKQITDQMVLISERLNELRRGHVPHRYG